MVRTSANKGLLKTTSISMCAGDNTFPVLDGVQNQKIYFEESKVKPNTFCAGLQWELSRFLLTMIITVNRKECELQ